MDDEIKRWTARGRACWFWKSSKTRRQWLKQAEPRTCRPSETEKWVEDGKQGMENALRANPQDLREQYEKQLKDLQEVDGEAMLELRAPKMNSISCWKVGK